MSPLQHNESTCVCFQMFFFLWCRRLALFPAKQILYICIRLHFAIGIEYCKDKNSYKTVLGDNKPSTPTGVTDLCSSVILCCNCFISLLACSIPWQKDWITVITILLVYTSFFKHLHLVPVRAPTTHKPA